MEYQNENESDNNDGKGAMKFTCKERVRIGKVEDYYEIKLTRLCEELHTHEHFRSASLTV